VRLEGGDALKKVVCPFTGEGKGPVIDDKVSGLFDVCDSHRGEAVSSEPGLHGFRGSGCEAHESEFATEKDHGFAGFVDGFAEYVGALPAVVFAERAVVVN
jgi:hypothetical protein